MILTREDVKELTRTGSLEVVLPKVPANAVQSVQIAVATPAVAVVRVTDYWPHRSGALVVVVELVKRNKPSAPKTKTRRDVVRLMKPRRGTTRDPRSAMRSASERPERPDDVPGTPHPDLRDSEPEMVDEGTENHFARRAHQSAEMRYLDRQLRVQQSEWDRILESCERLGVDPTRHLAAVERRKTDLEREIRKAERRKAA